MSRNSATRPAQCWHGGPAGCHGLRPSVGAGSAVGSHSGRPSTSSQCPPTVVHCQPASASAAIRPGCTTSFAMRLGRAGRDTRLGRARRVHFPCGAHQLRVRRRPARPGESAGGAPGAHVPGLARTGGPPRGRTPGSGAGADAPLAQRARAARSPRMPRLSPASFARATSPSTSAPANASRNFRASCTALCTRAGPSVPSTSDSVEAFPSGRLLLPCSCVRMVPSACPASMKSASRTIALALIPAGSGVRIRTGGLMCSCTVLFDVPVASPMARADAFGCSSLMRRWSFFLSSMAPDAQPPPGHEGRGAAGARRYRTCSAFAGRAGQPSAAAASATVA